jgi:hypothetical protein
MMLAWRPIARSRLWIAGGVAAIAAAACSTPKAPLAEPQAPQPFALLVIECPPILEEKDSGESGVFTASFELNLALLRDGNSLPIEGACARRTRPVHLPPGSGRLEAGYEERVKQRSSVLETPVKCELPTLSQEWVAGKTYVYRVTVAKRDPRGRFHSCNVNLTEAQADGAAATPAVPAPSSSAPAP